MATLSIPDHLLRQAGLTERNALVEFACRLFDAGKITLWSAAQLAGLDRNGIEDALLERGIPVYRPTVGDLAQDLDTLDRLGI
jgi:predicted HTH domain antitoxin